MRKTCVVQGAFAAKLLATLSACAVGPDYVRPDVAMPATYAQTVSSPYATTGEVQNLGEFWQQFNDPTLNELVRDAIAANHDLRIALARYQEARALRGGSRADLAPILTLSGNRSEQLFSVDQRTADGRAFDLYATGADVTWEIDFFGRLRRQLEASDARLDAAQAGLHETQSLITAEVTRTYFELRGLQQQLDVARRNVANQSQTLDLTRDRLDAGRGTELDVTRAQALLSGSTATIPPLEAGVQRAIHRLGVLTGREPGTYTQTLSHPQDLPVLPDLVVVDNPAALLRRRPDIRIAERELAAATARIGVAVADLFPRVTLLGQGGYAATEFSSLGDTGTGTRLIAPGLSWALLDLGHVRARIEASRAGSEAALSQYEQTVLRALEEAENAFVAHARARERMVHLSTSAEASSRAAMLARLRYENGIIDFLQVLDAERTQLDAEDRLATSRTETAASLVGVYKALGGGWAVSPLPR